MTAFPSLPLRLGHAALLMVLAMPLMGLSCSPSSAEVAKEQIADTVAAKRLPVQMNAPKTWRVIPSEELAKIGPNVIMAFSDDSVDGRGVRNMSVVEERMDNPLSSIQYAYANASLAADNLDDYTKLQEKDVTILNADNQQVTTRLHWFEARFDRKDPKRKYVQLYAAQGYYGYTATIQTVIDDLNTAELEQLILGFRFVKE